MQVATLAGGCFWCLEAVFLRMKGVLKVESGYIGGHVDSPTYRAVCNGTTGHAEAVQITIDPSATSFAQLLDVFFTIHDPTTLNRQGNDVGTQYRSAIFYHTPEQEAEARKKIAELSGSFDDPIVTQIEPASRFWAAEDYHQDYFASHGHEPYCMFVVAPKVKKFLSKHADLASQ